MQSRPNPILGLVSREFFETFDLYSQRDSDFHGLVAARLPADWRIQRSGIWFHCGSPANAVPEQGWKIHVSATVSDARETLNRVLAVLFQRQDTNFKFALDSYVLSLLNGKNWSRGGAGKFITVYPKDNLCFLDLIEELHKATLGQRGPYILSDQQYEKDSVVFYRYGGMLQRHALNIAGEKIALLTGPDGSDVPDRRLPFPVTPDWVEPPLRDIRNEGNLDEPMTLQNGRYQITGVLEFSNAGGVYRALDRKTGKKVVVKEARQHISSHGGDCNAVGLLQKEHRLLTLLAHSGISPQPYDLFEEWDHWFLVEEFIDGIPLARQVAEHSILLRTRPSPADFDLWFEKFHSLFRNLAHLVDIVHRHGIVFGDLSPNNLLLTSGSAELKLIDFEGACHLGVDAPINLFTPGFGSPNQVSGGPGTPEDDSYALGALICFCLFPLNGLLNLYPDARHNLLRNIQKDSQIPSAIVKLILELLSSDPSQRPSYSKIKNVLSSFQSRDRHLDCDQETSVDYGAVIKGIQDHIEDTATYSRKDRLFPADPKLFSTNPINLAYGAGGVAYALKQISNRVPEKAATWILQHEVTNDNYAPGLYVGSSGIAWSLLEIGFQHEAEKIFRRTLSHPLLYKAADIFYGLAGWGMTSLRFFRQTQDEEYLDHAKAAATTLLERSVRNQRGRYWMINNEVRLGLAHGASGVALFLLYLYLETGDSSFLTAGQEALEFDLSFGVETKDGGLSWPQSAESRSPLYPYWRFGSAGIGRVVLRFYRALKNQDLSAMLERIFIECDRKYAVFPGQFMGLSGLGEFSLDLYNLFGESRFLRAAEKAIRGIMLFRVERNGIAFPGDQLARLSCDYGTGSAGVALFLNRFVNRSGPHFMLDSLFDSTCAHTATASASAQLSYY
jgi:serine/threonine protein kinase